jgi:DNA processing protein
MSTACDDCLARPWLLASLSGHLDTVRPQIGELLELDNGELIAAVGGRRRQELERRLARVDRGLVRQAAVRAGLQLLCRCDSAYPRRLFGLASPPALLYLAGSLERFLAAVTNEPVAIVGARRASPYGTEIAHRLARGLGVAGLSVVSGMALGIDSAAHRGALEVGGATVAVLPGPADHAYPRANRGLHRQLTQSGVAVSELPPGTPVRSWMFPARNRIIAALAMMTVVVEASERSGALVTAAVARQLGRPLGAVPGRVTAVQAAGPNGLLRAGAVLVRDAQDILDVLFDAGSRTIPVAGRPELSPELQVVLQAIGEGQDTAAALTGQGIAPAHGLAALAALELGGYVRVEPGGRFAVVP